MTIQATFKIMRNVYIPLFWRVTGLKNLTNLVTLTKQWEINNAHDDKKIFKKEKNTFILKSVISVRPVAPPKEQEFHTAHDRESSLLTCLLQKPKISAGSMGYLALKGAQILCILYIKYLFSFAIEYSKISVLKLKRTRR